MEKQPYPPASQPPAAYPQPNPEQTQYAGNPDPPAQPPVDSYGSGYGATGGGTTTVVMAASPLRYGPNPQEMACPNCSEHVVTETRLKTSVLTWIVFGVLFALGFITVVTWFLCWIPFCVDACQDVDHVCPNCKRLLGSYKRMGA